MTNDTSENDIDQQIIQSIKDKKPETVGQLITIIKGKRTLTDQQILKHIQRLQEKERIHLKPPATQPQQTMRAYLQSANVAWYWITLALTAVTVVTVFTIPEGVYPQAYVRNVVGTIFVLWLPGYTFIKALFPQKLPIKTTDKDLDAIERIALSIGMSLALVPIVGLLLNYTPWGIRLTPITLSLTAVTMTFATAAFLRERQTRTSTTSPA